MRIELESLTLTNFKGAKQLQVKFGRQTDISGDNATFKTTIFDSFLWLLFGKDSMDRKDFEVKTLDSQGKVIPMIEHEVIGKLHVWDADDNDIPRTIILRRTFREKWVKPRGQSEAEFSGNETVYYVDQVPCTMKEYNEKVDSICKENLFKLLTNPAYFPGLNWSVQRQSLFNLIPTITNDDIMAAVNDKAMKQGKFSQLLKVLNAEKSLEDYRKQIANDIRRIKEEIVLIPARIDEVKRGAPEPEDWQALEKAIVDATAFIERKEEEKGNKLKSVEAETKKRSDIQADINSIKQRMTTIKYEIEDSIRTKMRALEVRETEHKQNISDYESLIKKGTSILSSLRSELEGLQVSRANLLAEWKEINSQVYDLEGRTTCPVCKQELPEESLALEKQLSIDRFNREKSFALEQNMKKGKSIAAQIKEKETEITDHQARLVKLNTDLVAVIDSWEGDVDSFKKGEGGVSPAAINFVSEVDKAIKAQEEYQSLKEKGTKLYTRLEKLGVIAAVDTSAIDKEILFARTSLDEKKIALSKRDQIAKAIERQVELETQQKKLAQEIATLEQMEFTIETFMRTKVSMLEERINSMFALVKFKMFNLQINGQLDETCECSIGGVPYSDLNRAARINAGLDIIRTMSAKHGIIAPVFIDNAESTNEFIPMEAQMVRLYVTKDKSLIIKSI
jgi:DNA repair protein SbcC/Rad50